MQPRGIYNTKNTLYTDVVQKTALIHETYALSLKQVAVTGIPQDMLQVIRSNHCMQISPRLQPPPPPPPPNPTQPTPRQD